MSDTDYQRRIKERAHRIWQDDGQPDGRADQHWELAKLAVDLEDSRETMLRPVEPEQPEPAEVLANLGEFPTLTDQGEQQAPMRIEK